MKRSMKKLTVFVMMAAIAIFIAAATASAGDHDQKTIGGGHGNAIVGEYAYSGMNSCITALPTLPPPVFTEANEGFTANGPVTYGVGSLQGIFTFKPHGQGTATARQVSVVLPQAIPPTTLQHPFASANSSDVSYDFTYNITHDGVITLEMVPGTMIGKYLTGPTAGATYTVDKISLSGLISMDYKTMTLGAVEPAVWTLTYLPQPIYPSGLTLYSICSTWRFLTRLEELHK